jgi:hypothetical protein
VTDRTVVEYGLLVAGLGHANEAVSESSAIDTKAIREMIHYPGDWPEQRIDGLKALCYPLLSCGLISHWTVFRARWDHEG